MVPIEAQFIDTCFYIKKNFPGTRPGVIGQKADIANYLFSPFFSSFNPTKYKCEWPSGQVDGLEFQCTDVRMGSTPPPPPPPPVSANFFPYFFHRFSHNLFFHLYTQRRCDGWGGGGGGGGARGKSQYKHGFFPSPHNINIIRMFVCLFICLFVCPSRYSS